MADHDRPMVVLASASPRRAALLGRFGLTPVIAPTAIDETPRPGEPASTLVVRLAAAKAAAADPDAAGAAVPPVGQQVAAADLRAAVDPIVLAADTEVVLGDTPLGKPTTAHEARTMLRGLSGRTHRVLTGVAVRRAQVTVTALAQTAVRFRTLSDDEIDWYLATDEPWDKAGGYAIQGAGGVFVDHLDGSDSNVIGLPLATTIELLRRVGFDPLAAPGGASDRPSAHDGR